MWLASTGNVLAAMASSQAAVASCGPPRRYQNEVARRSSTAKRRRSAAGGDFRHCVAGRRGFSANVQDLIAAAAHMASLGHAPALLIGHSLGGAAALAAAGEIASVAAVATIGAPAEVEHVLKLLGDGVAKIEAEGVAEVK